MALEDFLQSNEASQYLTIYDFQVGNETFRFTSFEKDVVFNSVTYSAAPIENKGFTADTKLKATALSVAVNLSVPATRFIANTPTPNEAVKEPDRCRPLGIIPP